MYVVGDGICAQQCPYEARSPDGGTGTTTTTKVVQYVTMYGSPERLQRQRSLLATSRIEVDEYDRRKRFIEAHCDVYFTAITRLSRILVAESLSRNFVCSEESNSRRDIASNFSIGIEVIDEEHRFRVAQRTAEFLADLKRRQRKGRAEVIDLEGREFRSSFLVKFERSFEAAARREWRRLCRDHSDEQQQLSRGQRNNTNSKAVEQQLLAATHHSTSPDRSLIITLSGSEQQMNGHHVDSAMATGPTGRNRMNADRSSAALSAVDPTANCLSHMGRLVANAGRQQRGAAAAQYGSRHSTIDHHHLHTAVESTSTADGGLMKRDATERHRRRKMEAFARCAAMTSQRWSPPSTSPSTNTRSTAHLARSYPAAWEPPPMMAHTPHSTTSSSSPPKLAIVSPHSNRQHQQQQRSILPSSSSSPRGNPQMQRAAQMLLSRPSSTAKTATKRTTRQHPSAFLSSSVWAPYRDLVSLQRGAAPHHPPMKCPPSTAALPPQDESPSLLPLPLSSPQSTGMMETTTAARANVAHHALMSRQQSPPLSGMVVGSPAVLDVRREQQPAVDDEKGKATPTLPVYCSPFSELVPLPTEEYVSQQEEIDMYFSSLKQPQPQPATKNDDDDDDIDRRIASATAQRLRHGPEMLDTDDDDDDDEEEEGHGVEDNDDAPQQLDAAPNVGALMGVVDDDDSDYDDARPQVVAAAADDTPSSFCWEDEDEAAATEPFPPPSASAAQRAKTEEEEAADCLKVKEEAAEQRRSREEDRYAKADADRRAKEEDDRKAKEEDDRKAKEEDDRKAKADDVDRRAKEEEAKDQRKAHEEESTATVTAHEAAVTTAAAAVASSPSTNVEEAPAPAITSTAAQGATARANATAAPLARSSSMISKLMGTISFWSKKQQAGDGTDGNPPPLPSALIDGDLHKESGAALSPLQCRYFHLGEDHYLRWFPARRGGGSGGADSSSTEQQQAASILGDVDVSNAKIIDRGTYRGLPCFSIDAVHSKKGRKEYFLFADSRDAKTRWVQLLMSCSSRYRFAERRGGQREVEVQYAAVLTVELLRATCVKCECVRLTNGLQEATSGRGKRDGNDTVWPPTSMQIAIDTIQRPLYGSVFSDGAIIGSVEILLQKLLPLDVPKEVSVQIEGGSNRCPPNAWLILQLSLTNAIL